MSDCEDCHRRRNIEVGCLEIRPGTWVFQATVRVV